MITNKPIAADPLLIPGIQPVRSKRAGSAVLFFGVYLLCFFCLSAAPLPAQDSSKNSLTVMSYNVRYGTAQDGINHWSKRKEQLIDVIRKYDPDLLGTQETLAFQGDYISQHLPHLESFGVGRDDGKLGGEMALLFFRKDRFKKLDGGNFWLSESPEKIASKSWDSALPRIVSWVVLQDQTSPGQPKFLFLNTHFDHRGTQARIESSRIIREFIADYSQKFQFDLPVIVAGDFNAGEGSLPYRELVDQEFVTKRRLVDTFRSVHPEKGDEEGTFSGFDVNQSKGGRIDWILVSDEWKIRSASIDRTATEGRTPSDHFPILAEIEWPDSPAIDR